MRRRNSLRSRLTSWFTVLLTAIGLLGGAGAYLLTRQDPDNFLDDQLRQIALNVGVSAGAPQQDPEPVLDPSDLIVVQVWDAEHHVLRSTPPEIVLPQQPATGFSDLFSGTEQWRTYTWVTDDGTVQVSQKAEVRRELALEAMLPAGIILGLLFPLSWLLVRRLVRRILKPLDQLTHELASRLPDSTRPLTVHDVPEEIVPLVKAMNLALDRIRETLLLQRRFVSDAAHQFRTPLTALRLQIGNLKRLPGSRSVEILQDMDLGLQRMSVLTEQLLALARAETPVPCGSLGSVRLSDILEEAIGGVLPLAHRKEVTIASASPSDAEVPAERHDLVMLFSNLIDNAVRYTSAGGRVEVTTAISDRSVTVEITDTGPGLPDDMLSRVFDRFVRNTDDGDGTGLGLSIVKAIAEKVGAHVVLRNRVGARGLVAHVECPRSV